MFIHYISCPSLCRNSCLFPMRAADKHSGWLSDLNVNLNAQYLESNVTNTKGFLFPGKRTTLPEQRAWWKTLAINRNRRPETSHGWVTPPRGGQRRAGVPSSWIMGVYKRWQGRTSRTEESRLNFELSTRPTSIINVFPDHLCIPNRRSVISSTRGERLKL